MLKTECDIPEEHRSGVQVASVSLSAALELVEQWHIRKDSPYYAHMIACLQTDCGKCLAYILQKKNDTHSR